MNKYLTIIVLAVFGLSFSKSSLYQDVQNPQISFSFDDGSTSNFPGYALEEWNQLLLDNLAKHEVQAILFVKGSTMDNSKGKRVIRSWDDAGHLIGNHTYSHPYFHSENVSLEEYQKELLRNDSLIKGYSNYTRHFRFPYLKEGNTLEKRDGFRAFLKEQDYQIGHVTIDASDWYVHSRVVKRLKENPEADLSGFKAFYIEHLNERALFYDSLAFALTGRRIKHNLLLHHNLAAALFLDDLIQHFKDEGWDVVDVDDAYQDEIYTRVPDTLPAGESLIWALARQAGTYDDVLRYPAEDGDYEKEKMDRLGL